MFLRNLYIFLNISKFLNLTKCTYSNQYHGDAFVSIAPPLNHHGLSLRSSYSVMRLILAMQWMLVCHVNRVRGCTANAFVL